MRGERAPECLKCRERPAGIEGRQLVREEGVRPGGALRVGGKSDSKALAERKDSRNNVSRARNGTDRDGENLQAVCRTLAF